MVGPWLLYVECEMGMFEWKRADLEDGDRFENCLKYVLQLTLSSLRINEEKQTLIIFLLIGQRAGLVLNTSKIVMLATVIFLRPR